MSFPILTDKVEKSMVSSIPPIPPRVRVSVSTLARLGGRARYTDTLTRKKGSEKSDATKKRQRRKETRMTQFFMAMRPPTVTAQERAVRVVHGKPVFYEPPELKDARGKLCANLAKHKPEKPYTGPVRLKVIWCFALSGKHFDGEFRTTKPDTDNLQKLLKDCMTAVGFWKDDAIVTVEHVEKYWAQMPGIYICVEKIRRIRRS